MNKKIIASVIAAGSLFLNALTPLAFASDSVTLTGNGSGSANSASVSQNHDNTTVQNNSADISNNVSSTSNTGGNVASGNTGGDVLVSTGNSNQRVAIDNRANLNQATLGCNCPASGGTDLTISGNGSGSSNSGSVDSNHSNSLFQTNDANFSNNVSTEANSGNNIATGNTGSTRGLSQFTVLTGSATSWVGIQNQANANIAEIGGVGSGVSALAPTGANVTISGNGSGSGNSASLSSNDSNTVVQDNQAAIDNYVWQTTNTGQNYANDNTGGDVFVGTGHTQSWTGVDNQANFNWASLDCGCTTGGFTGKISGNGSYSGSTLTADHNSNDSMFQNNNGSLSNAVITDTASGQNYTSDNTGSVGYVDPVRVLTGSTSSDNWVSNETNANLLGSGIALPNGWSLNFGWNTAALW